MCKAIRQVGVWGGVLTKLRRCVENYFHLSHFLSCTKREKRRYMYTYLHTHIYIYKYICLKLRVGHLNIGRAKRKFHFPTCYFSNYLSVSKNSETKKFSSLEKNDILTYFFKIIVKFDSPFFFRKKNLLGETAPGSPCNTVAARRSFRAAPSICCSPAM